ncbi:MAG: c-type cytochrome [Myxococcales bacterium]|nr:c-type cytochrome [Myxococcales bacterium]
MKRWMTSSHWVALLFAVIFALVSVGSVSDVRADGPDKAALLKHAGKAVFTKARCGSCHSVNALDLKRSASDDEEEEDEGTPPPDLSDVGTKGHDAQVISDYLTKKGKLNGKNHKKKFKGSDEDLKALAEWITSLKFPAAK